VLQDFRYTKFSFEQTKEIKTQNLSENNKYL